MATIEKFVVAEKYPELSAPNPKMNADTRARLEAYKALSDGEGFAVGITTEDSAAERSNLRNALIRYLEQDKDRQKLIDALRIDTLTDKKVFVVTKDDKQAKKREEKRTKKDSKPEANQ